MAKYTEQEIGTLIGWFPALGKDPHFQITSDCTPAYNCIGWALGMNDVWVGLDHPINYAWTWWPKEVPCDEKPGSLIALFEHFGFIECEDASIEEDYDKVALFADEEGWTHAARVIGDNLMHSKIGTAWDIHHSGGNTLDDTMYGTIFAYMKRPISERYLTDIKKPRAGTIIINDI
ncbi:MAG: hypothetical protein MJZ33_11385 [Paludibacteraceae bacterium]|nr:hypothetical protein [Paludibacteraceae bacterium]